MSVRCQVLIVDDDVQIRETIGDVLLDEGYTVEAAANGRDALDKLKEGKPAAIVLLDLMMPVMSGWEFLEVKSRDPAIADIPVLVMTASGAPKPAGAGGVVRKPFNIEALLGAVGALCGTLN